MTTTQETRVARPVPRLKERYRQEIAPALREEFAYANVMQIPTLTKIVVNMGVGEAARDAKLIDGALRDLTVITGQKPAVARATAGFWPVMRDRSRTAPSISFASRAASPTPMLTTILDRPGICMTLA